MRCHPTCIAEAAVLPPVDENLPNEWDVGDREQPRHWREELSADGGGTVAGPCARPLTWAHARSHELGTTPPPLEGGQAAFSDCVPAVQLDGQALMDGYGCRPHRTHSRTLQREHMCIRGNAGCLRTSDSSQQHESGASRGVQDGSSPGDVWHELTVPNRLAGQYSSPGV